MATKNGSFELNNSLAFFKYTDTTLIGDKNNSLPQRLDDKVTQFRVSESF